MIARFDNRTKCWLSIFWVLITFGINNTLYAQRWDEQPGEIEEAEVVIEKNIQIVLPFAARNYERIPPQPIAIKPGPLSYAFISVSPEIQPINPRLRAVTIQREELQKLYGGYVKGGFGNYISPLVDAYFFTKRNDKFSAGIYGNYLAGFRGPVDKENSASSDLNLGLTGSLYGEDAQLKTSINYNRLGRYFYGYPDGLTVERDTISQVINRFGAELDVDGELSTTPWLYQMGAGYRMTVDDYDARENNFRISGGLGYKTRDDNKIIVLASYDYFLRNDELIDDLSRNVLTIKPAYDFVYNRIKIYAGLNMVLENDDVRGLNKFHVYPDVQASYNLATTLKVFGGVTGNINIRTLDYWLQQNPLLGINSSIYHSNTNLEIFGGFEGQIINPLSFRLDVSVSSIKNMAYLVNDPRDISRFYLAYDPQKTSMVKVGGELSLQRENSRTWLRGTYFNYSTGAIEEPWHLPEAEAFIGTSLNIYDKIMLSGSFNSLFGIKAFNLVNQATIELDPVIDLDLQIDYLLSKIAGIFVQANNIISMDNTRYYRYPSRGFQVIAGVNISF